VPDVRLASEVPYHLEVMLTILVAMEPSNGLGVFMLPSLIFSCLSKSSVCNVYVVVRLTQTVPILLGNV
jgi:hypothetical protein